MMSKELDGLVPDLEDAAFEKYQDAYIVVGLQCHNKKETHIFTGSLVGLSNEVSIVKIDMNIGLSEAYKFLRMSSDIDFLCKACYLFYCEDEIQILTCDYTVKTSKIVEIDREKKMCVLGVDLIRA